MYISIPSYPMHGDAYDSVINFLVPARRSSQVLWGIRSARYTPVDPASVRATVLVGSPRSEKNLLNLGCGDWLLKTN